LLVARPKVLGVRTWLTKGLRYGTQSLLSARAPSAIRTAISLRRRPTPYAIVPYKPMHATGDHLAVDAFGAAVGGKRRVLALGASTHAFRE
jgi:hypothetical protein